MTAGACLFLVLFVPFIWWCHWFVEKPRSPRSPDCLVVQAEYGIRAKQMDIDLWHIVLKIAIPVYNSAIAIVIASVRVLMYYTCTGTGPSVMCVYSSTYTYSISTWISIWPYRCSTLVGLEYTHAPVRVLQYTVYLVLNTRVPTRVYMHAWVYTCTTTHVIDISQSWVEVFFASLRLQVRINAARTYPLDIAILKQ